MCSMIRRFVHLIVDDLKGGAYSLRNIDMKPLFAGVDRATKMRTARLPRPVACFESYGQRYNNAEFFLLGSKIVSVNMNRRTIMYDTATSAVRAGPEFQRGTYYQPAWAALQGKLYLVNEFTDTFGLPCQPCFQALHYDDCREDWFWDSLPLPSFLASSSSNAGVCIQAFAAGDDRNIWISTTSHGTYTFDAMTVRWRKEGDWTLPFEGRVQYIPEYDICFGFSRGSRNLCSAHLAVGAMASEGPLYQDVWDDVDGYTGAKWQVVGSYLTYLGGGRFCVTRFYDTMVGSEEPTSCEVAVVTAVEARQESMTGKLQMIKGASRCYKLLPTIDAVWVL